MTARDYKLSGEFATDDAKRKEVPTNNVVEDEKQNETLVCHYLWKNFIELHEVSRLNF